MTHKTLHLNKKASNKLNPSLAERHTAHQSETSKRFLIKRVEESNLSTGDKRSIVKLIGVQ